MDPFVAEIRIFGFNFPPKGWAFCNGQLLAISQNTALFSLVGTYYGGDGKSTFALPDMQGNAPMNWGQGPGLSNYDLGEMAGSEFVTLLQGEMPSHSHGLQAANFNASDNIPTSNDLARGAGGLNAYAAPGGAVAQMSPLSIGFQGGDQPHNNMMPYLTMNFCIAMQGVYPPRT